jgi:hypothetical protein
MLRTLINTAFSILKNERGAIATSTLLAAAAVAAVAATGITAIASAGGGGGGGGAGPQEKPPEVGSGSQDFSRDEMRKRGRAALIGSSPVGVLGNPTTGRSQLLGN